MGIIKLWKFNWCWGMTSRCQKLWNYHSWKVFIFDMLRDFLCALYVKLPICLMDHRTSTDWHSVGLRTFIGRTSASRTTASLDRWSSRTRVNLSLQCSCIHECVFVFTFYLWIVFFFTDGSLTVSCHHGVWVTGCRLGEQVSRGLCWKFG